MRSLVNYSRFSIAYWIYLVLVILLGAWVRISGSGAGCGDHWPSCDGALLPQMIDQHRIIEFSHRASTGLLGILTIGLWWGAWRVSDPGSPIRRFASATAFFIVTESLLGALLVKKGLVTDNASVSRALVASLHLLNTLALSASSVLLILATYRPTLVFQLGKTAWLFLAMTLVVSAMGAVTALGDTLFPVAPVEGNIWLGRMSEELSQAEHFLVRLRVVHPALASLFVVAIFYWLANRRGSEGGYPRALRGALLIQLSLGMCNIALGVPGWLQIAHLAVAHIVWGAQLWDATAYSSELSKSSSSAT